MCEDTFPDVRWGQELSPRLMKVITRLIGTRFGSWCIRRLTPLDRNILSRSNGRFTVFGPLGVPLLLLITTGKKSGQRRQTPLAYMREDGRLFLIGSNFGKSTHPAWSWNLLADPKAWIMIGGKEIPVKATQVTGAEYERIFRKFADYGNNYTAYRERATRELRVFALTRR